MTSWYSSETDVDVWYQRVHVVRYELPFVDKELEHLDQHEANDARFTQFLDNHDDILKLFCSNVQTCLFCPNFCLLFKNFISWNEEPHAQFHAGLVNYCQLAVKQHRRFQKNLRFIALIAERERVRGSIVRYLRIARKYTQPYRRTCSIIEFWHAKVQETLSEITDLEAEQLAYVRDESPVFQQSVSFVGPQFCCLISWYQGLRIVPYKLTFVHERFYENMACLRALMEKDRIFQLFLHTNKDELDFLVNSVEYCKKQGRTYKGRLRWGDKLPMGCDLKRDMLHRGLVNYCRFAVKQHICFLHHVPYISSQSERMRVKAQVRRCLEYAKAYVDPFFHTDDAFESWYTSVNAALAEFVDTDGPEWIEE
jgi:hypothetical protein